MIHHPFFLDCFALNFPVKIGTRGLHMLLVCLHVQVYTVQMNLEALLSLQDVPTSDLVFLISLICNL